ncbi:hypothetical protein Ciccas_000170 [Cichlidogyrus casuarinus]|uniref:Uncharacterized protein n=1 Tax=Cichlidogyrus casuarinus TaxID=1844966 RepID=A0ABD2QNN5_9PLAT
MSLGQMDLSSMSIASNTISVAPGENALFYLDVILSPETCSFYRFSFAISGSSSWAASLSTVRLASTDLECFSSNTLQVTQK